MPTTTGVFKNTSNDFHKLGASHSQEGHLSLCRHGLGQQGLPATRGSEEQRALRNLGSQLEVPLRVLTAGSNRVVMRSRKVEGKGEQRAGRLQLPTFR